jgi:hypothetical protein
LEYLSSQKVIGIDSETRPSFTKGQSHKVALLQISSDDICFLFRLNMIGLTPSIIQLLENPHVIKVGLSLKDDFMMLRKRAPFKQQACFPKKLILQHLHLLRNYRKTLTRILKMMLILLQRMQLNSQMKNPLFLLMQKRPVIILQYMRISNL